MAAAESEERVTVPVLKCAWLKVGFLHWRFDADAIQSLLPHGLVVDTFDGSAWVTMAPFLMADVRPPFLPSLGRAGTFAETNLRTYVRGPSGSDGIWFFGIEAHSVVMTTASRAMVGAPYHAGRLSIDERDGEMSYAGARRGGEPSYRVVVRPGAVIEASERDVWLTGRWRAYTRHLGRLLETPVAHEPWLLHAATLLALEETLTAAGGLLAPDGDPLVHYSEGVRDVRVGVTRVVD